uniref:NADH dehydrogenase subunit 6 n=1 Tax=Styela clava TaxID=7725 RepID=A0A024HVY3_STYCL|nr:NADH dehydrogenase subunit 6 [Styela clava]CDM98925.1 NADH dehydrogenase subunit 6 [Styela clava]
MSVFFGLNGFMFFLVIMAFSVIVVLKGNKYSHVIFGLILYSVLISLVMCIYFNMFFSLLFMLVYVGGLLLFMLYVLTMVGISEKTAKGLSYSGFILMILIIDGLPFVYESHSLFNLFSVYSVMYCYMFVAACLLGFLLYICLELLFFYEK